MPREFARNERLGEQIQRVVGTVLLSEVGDPRLSGVVVTEVKVSKDLSHAKLFLTAPSGRADQDVLVGMSKALGFIRRQLARRLHVRAVPNLHFEIDHTLATAERIDQLLAKVARSEGAAIAEWEPPEDQARPGSKDDLDPWGKA